MTRFTWHLLAPHSETQPPTEHPQAMEIPQNHHRHSKLGHVMNSIRYGLANEHEKLPTKDGMAQQDSQLNDTTNLNNGSLSPALQAVASFKIDENNMGEDSHQNNKDWGWPGLGAFTSYEPTTRTQSKQRSISNGSGMEARAGAATFEAIDNAADSETYGWPGLGSWNTCPRK